MSTANLIPPSLAWKVLCRIRGIGVGREQVSLIPPDCLAPRCWVTARILLRLYRGWLLSKRRACLGFKRLERIPAQRYTVACHHWKPVVLPLASSPLGFPSSIEHSTALLLAEACLTSDHLQPNLLVDRSNHLPPSQLQHEPTRHNALVGAQRRGLVATGVRGSRL